MKNAKSTDKNLVIELLESSFDTNMSVNYIIPQNQNRAKRKRALMNYSFDICTLFGKVLISNDEKGCALILYPDKKKSTIKSIFLDLKLIIECIGFRNIKKTLSREALIRKLHPNELMSYIWYIGVDPEYQNQGIGSALLNEIIEDSKLKNRAIYLETSTIKNLPWYQKFGFEIYNEYDLSYHLYFLRRLANK